MFGLTAAVVAQAFGLGAPTSELVAVDGALSHKVCRLTTDCGEFAVKIYNRFWDRPEWLPRLEGSWRIELRAFENDVSMPTPVVPANSQWPWVVIDGSNGVAQTVRVHHWVRGERLPWTGATVEQADQVGRILAVLHRVGEGAGPWQVLPRPSPPFRDWEGMDAVWLARLAPLEPLFDWASNLVTAAASERVALVWTHRDVTPKNTLVHAGSGRVVIVDWDVAWRERPDQELARAVLEFAGADAREPSREVMQALACGYRDAGGRLALRRTSLAGWAGADVAWLALNIARSNGYRIQSGDDRELARREAERVLATLARLYDRHEQWMELLLAL